MFIVEFIYQIIIYPLELLFELVFSMELRYIPSEGLAIVILSLFVNLLLFPIYGMLNEIVKEQKKRDEKIQYWQEHIRKTFHGDERFFMIRTFYRQNGYHPISSLKGVFPLLLEFPFFIAAYHFISSLSQLSGVPFLNIKDLGMPDGMLVFGDLTVNALPVVMTIVNIISSTVYSGKKSRFEKLYLYGISIIFLAVLYHSPAGLVLYWICNNLFALFKNIFFCVENKNGLKKKNWPKKKTHFQNVKSETIDFIICNIAMILLVGAVIPSAVIKASPLEFVDVSKLQNPLFFLKDSILISIGFFGIWIPFFYYIAENKRHKLYVLLSVLSCFAVIDYFYFATGRGYISSNLIYNEKLEFEDEEYLLNFVVLIVVILICIYIFENHKRLMALIHTVSVIVFLFMVILNGIEITNEYNNSDFSETSDQELMIPLSTAGKNVVVIMLDRAVGAYVPYIMGENSQLKKQFSGFTFYPNTVSFGFYTGEASGAVFGGYDYIDIQNVNERNEALKLMPQLFAGQNYRVTVFDPPLANGGELSDLSIYKDLPVAAFHAHSRFHYSYGNNKDADRRFRNFFCYAFCRCMPLILQTLLYDDGYYNDVTVYAIHAGSSHYSNMNHENDISTGISFNGVFENEFAELCSLSEITRYFDEPQNTFFMCYNATTHEPTILKEPEYLPALYVDNTEYDQAHWDRFELNGKKMRVETADQMYHYQVNMASLMQLGKWFDELRERGVYDNTRIILVADHGISKKQFADLIQPCGIDAQAANPLLMVKDFNAKEYTTDNTFMTNADVPTLAFDQLIENPVNPFNGNRVTSEYKQNETIVIHGYSVKDNIFDSKNWEKIIP